MTIDELFAAYTEYTSADELEASRARMPHASTTTPGLFGESGLAATESE